MHRCYFKNIDLTQNEITSLDVDEIHHIKNVLRLKKGSQLTLFSDSNIEAIAEIKNISPKKIELNIVRLNEPANDNQTSIILACAPPKKGKFELIIEKTTELGIDEIYPLKTERTEVILKGDRLKKKHDRFITVAINAAKQSKRTSIPVIHPLTTFLECIKSLKKQEVTILIPSLQEKAQTLAQYSNEIIGQSKIAILIGPEGDFTEEEYALAAEEGCKPVTLGPTVLKVETAAICAISYIRQATLTKTH